MRPTCESNTDLKSSSRSRFATATLLVALVALGGRLVQIQVLDHAGLAARALRQHGRFERLPARPGDVLDVHGRPLATSIETASIFVDPKSIPPEKRDDVATSLAVALELDAAALCERLAKQATIEWTDSAGERRTGKRFLWVKRRVSEHEVRAVRDLKWPPGWVAFHTELERCYPQGRIASHVIGLRDVDGKARDGIERVFDPLIGGRAGFRVSSRDARGKTLAVHDDLTQAPSPGSSVVLTIDSVIQSFAEETLEKVMADWQPASATAIVMDPRTGEVLALANRPTFDPHDPAAAAKNAWVNRAVSDIYEPGSTFKPFIVSAALDWGVVKPDDQINCHQGVYRMGPRLLHSHHANGVLSVPDVVIKSDNIGMAVIGERMTNGGLHRAVQSFGFGRRTGIELPGESVGSVRPLRAWTPFYSTGSVPMGQELAATPLQIITAFCALANGGELLRPRIVRAIVDPAGNTVQVFDKPVAVGRPVSSQTAQFMVETVLTGVVERGTGKRCQIPGYSIFGKTGTAQKLAEHGGYSHGHHVSSFIAGAPASNPQIVVYVVVNDPSKGREHYGGEVAAPAVKQILQQSLVYLRVPYDRELRDVANKAGRKNEPRITD
jgi:cell division protein FtsI/penicillin-binding protein 2